MAGYRIDAVAIERGSAHGLFLAEDGAGQRFKHHPDDPYFDTATATSHYFAGTPEGLADAERIAELYATDPVGVRGRFVMRSKVVMFDATGERTVSEYFRTTWPPPERTEPAMISPWLAEYRAQRRQARIDARPPVLQRVTHAVGRVVWFGILAVLIVVGLLIGAWVIQSATAPCEGEYVATIDRTTECVEDP